MGIYFAEPGLSFHVAQESEFIRHDDSIRLFEFRTEESDSRIEEFEVMLESDDRATKSHGILHRVLDAFSAELAQDIPNLPLAKNLRLTFPHKNLPDSP